MAVKKKIDIQINSLSPALGETIRQCRLALRMSPREFANQLHTSLTFVLQIERAEVAMTSQILEDCAQILGLSPQELVDMSMSKKMMMVLEPVDEVSSMECSA